jgi:hypothetical protein
MAVKDIVTISGPDGVDCFISKEEYEKIGYKVAVEKYMLIKYR